MEHEMRPADWCSTGSNMDIILDHCGSVGDEPEGEALDFPDHLCCNLHLWSWICFWEEERLEYPDKPAATTTRIRGRTYYYIVCQIISYKR